MPRDKPANRDGDGEHCGGSDEEGFVHAVSGPAYPHARVSSGLLNQLPTSPFVGLVNRSDDLLTANALGDPEVAINNFC